MNLRRRILSLFLLVGWLPQPTEAVFFLDWFWSWFSFLGGLTGLNIRSGTQLAKPSNGDFFNPWVLPDFGTGLAVADNVAVILASSSGTGGPSSTSSSSNAFVYGDGSPFNGLADSFQLQQSLVPTNNTDDDPVVFQAVAMSDNEILLASSNNVLYFFIRDENDQWVEEESKQIVLSDYGTPLIVPQRRGLAWNGNTLVVGSPSSRTVLILVRTTTTSTAWSQPVRLVRNENSFGRHVALSGNTILVSADGTAFAYVRPTEEWVVQHQFAGSWGGDVALEDNRAVLLPERGDRATVFVREGESWSQEAELYYENYSIGSSFYQSKSTASISGNKIVLGGTEFALEFTRESKTWLFFWQYYTWTESIRIFGTTLLDPSFNGWVAAISDNLALVCAPDFGDIFTPGTGACFAYNVKN